jgi:DNA-binding transcriptional ArsR family regulator
MEITTLFTEQKWNILRSLASHEASPLQLAEKSDTTIANISQQLRLLEAAELVKKKKIKNREKGKPRTLFSLSNDYAYLISTMRHFAKKKLLVLNDYHKFILRVLYLENTELHYFLSKFYWKIEDVLPQIDAIILIPGDTDIKLIVISDKAKEIEKKLGTAVVKKPGSEQKTISVQGLTKEELSKWTKQKKAPFDSSHTLQTIYDSEGLISSLTIKKEGDN